MKKTFKKLITILLTLAMVFNMSMPAMAATSVANLGALLDSYTAGSGTYTATSESRVYVIASNEPTGDLLQTAQLIQRQLCAKYSNNDAFEWKLVWGEEKYIKSGDIVLQLNTGAGIGADGYQLVVTDSAKIIASDVDGLLYGAYTIMKCMDCMDGYSFTQFTAADTPDTKERTVHLDTARKYYTVEWICNFIRQMSWMGYNALEMHFSEDGGFRADLWDPAYYKGSFQPENDFSWLCGSYIQSWVYDETLPDGTTGKYTNDPDKDKYLTTAELVQICEVAKEYHIEIIPSFDSPAHMDYITWKFEQNYKSNNGYSFTYNGTTYKASSTSGCINYTGRTGQSSPTWPHYTTIDITDGTMAKAFVFALYEDMADFFREYAGSTNFNIGADEVNMTSSSTYWPRKWSYSQFPGYVNDLNRMLNNKGYTVRMYNDFIGSTTYNKSSSDKAIYDFDDNIEICYWTSDFHPTTGAWSEPVWHVKFFWENNTGTTDNWGDGGRTMYNCIQTNTYYVLRIGTSGNNRDARDPENRNWTFYHTNEEAIYNEWYPADISEKGVYTENAADVPADQLGGAYFLIWNDYAALNTEKEVWEGAKDGWDKDRYYYLFDIMYSNIIKMWNADINSSVNYTNFAAVRDELGWFPGYKGCSDKASLPAAEAIQKALVADHTVLDQFLAEGKITNTTGQYTADSYAAYEVAYNEAVAVNQNVEATQDVVNAAVAKLEAAKAALVDLSGLKDAIASKVDNAAGNYTTASYAAYESAYTAAQELIDKTDATNEQINAAINALTTAEAALVDLTSLKAAVDDKINNTGNYTVSSYADYVTAYNAANSVLIDEDATVGEVNSAISNLTAAEEALVDLSELNKQISTAESIETNGLNYTEESYARFKVAYADALAVRNDADATKDEVQNSINLLSQAIAQLEIAEEGVDSPYVEAEMLTSKARCGKKIGVIVTTPATVTELKVMREGSSDVIVLDLCAYISKTINDEAMKVWMIYFPAGNEAGEFTYFIYAGNNTEQHVEQLDVTVQ